MGSVVRRLDQQEVDRRVSDLDRTLGILERGEGIRRHMQTTKEGGT